MVEESSKQAPLDELMLAMDVVDTLRHRELLVSRELNSAQREQTLIRRLRELYASQGIEVPDRILEEGVVALGEDRFSYTPPQPGLQTRLALMYVQRSKWIRRGALLLVIALLIWGAYYMLVQRPEMQRIDRQIGAISSGIEHNISTLESLEHRKVTLEERLQEAGDEGAPSSLMPQYDVASRGLIQAGDNIERAAALEFPEMLERSNFQELSAQYGSGLQQQQGYLDAAARALRETRNALDQVEALAVLPGQIEGEYAAVAQIARDQAALTQAGLLNDAARAALRAGDSDAAQAALVSLVELRNRLVQSYRLRVVSGPGETSGIWRVPDDNPGARNYYLIVEAVSDAGKILTLPLDNEEDGNRYRVDRWGLRVDRDLFERVARDKKDDGIIQMRELGRKRSGYLEPEYDIKTNGATITSW